MTVAERVMAYIHAFLSPKMWKERKKGLENTQEDYGSLIGTYLTRESPLLPMSRNNEHLGTAELRFQHATLVTAASDSKYVWDYILLCQQLYNLQLQQKGMSVGFENIKPTRLKFTGGAVSIIAQ